MAYQIVNSRGDVIAVLNSGQDNVSATSLTLFGPNYPQYGQAQNENFVYLLENFANTSAPANPTLGQLWYNSATNVMYQYNFNNQWVALATEDYVQAQKVSPIFTGVPRAPTQEANNASNQIATTLFVQNAINARDFAPKVSPAFTGTPTGPTAPSTTGDNQLATTEYVVNRFNRVDLSPYAPKDNPVFTGVPQAPLPPPNDNTAQIATTAWVSAELGNIDLALYAKINSPVFTGLPKAPTPAISDNSTNIATTAFVQGLYGNIDLSPYAPKVSPTLSGIPSAPTASAATNTNQIATTNFVQLQKDSPAFTGTPTAPTPASSDNSTKIATTAFVKTVFNGVPTPGGGAVDELAGSIKLWGSASPPANWALCNGQAVSRTAYATLFARIGTTYGSGDGSTTFNLPNLTNRVAVGAGDKFAAGSTGGYLDAALVSHTHTASSTFSGTPVSGAHNHSVSDSGHSHYIAVRSNTGDFGSDWVKYPEMSVTYGHSTGGPHSYTFTGRDAGNKNFNYSEEPTANIGRTSIAQSSSGKTTDATINITPTGVVSTSIAAPAGAVPATDRNMPPYQAAYWIIKLSDDGSGGGTLQAGAGIDITTAGAYSTITNTGIRNILAGTNVTVNIVNGVATINSSGGGGGGSTTVTGGTGISVSTVGSVATVTNTGVTSVNGQTGSVTIQAGGGSTFQAGTVMAWAGTTAPSGWQFCDGSSYSTAAYPVLFSRIGYAYGGSGATFNVPNLTNRFAVGAGGLYNRGATGGSKDAVTVSHSHSVSISTTGYDNPQGGNYPLATDSREISGPFSTSNVVIESSGVSGTDKNMPPYVATLWIIKMDDDGYNSGGTLQGGNGISIQTQGSVTTITATGTGGGATIVAGPGIQATQTAGGTYVQANVVSVTSPPNSGIAVTNSGGNISLALTGTGALTAFYESPEMTYPSNNNILHGEFDHGLGQTPKLVQAVLINTVAQYNWSPGDEIVWNNDYCPGYYYVQMGSNGNKVYLNVGGLVLVGNKTTPTAGGAAINKNNWRWKIRAWA